MTMEHFLKKNIVLQLLIEGEIKSNGHLSSSFSIISKKRAHVHVHVHEGVSVYAEGRLVGLAVLVHLLMVPQVGLAGKALVAQQAGEGLLLSVDPSVAYELSGHAERLPTLQALVALGLCVNASVVLEGHQVGELFLANGAEEGTRLVAVLVVEEGAGVAIRAATVLTHVALLLGASGVVTLL